MSRDERARDVPAGPQANDHHVISIGSSPSMSQSWRNMAPWLGGRPQLSSALTEPALALTFAYPTGNGSLMAEPAGAHQTCPRSLTLPAAPGSIAERTCPRLAFRRPSSFPAGCGKVPLPLSRISVHLKLSRCSLKSPTAHHDHGNHRYALPRRGRGTAASMRLQSGCFLKMNPNCSNTAAAAGLQRKSTTRRAAST